jgi:hypothetical protein
VQPRNDGNGLSHTLFEADFGGGGHMIGQ